MALSFCFIIRFTMRACQGFYGVFGILGLAGLVSIGALAAPHPATPGDDALSVDVVAWSPRPYADVVATSPELAACHLLAPASWSAARPAASLTSPRILGETVEAQLRGVLDTGAPIRFTVVVAETEESALSAVAAGATVLLLLPSSTPWAVHDAARAVISALARGHSAPAARDARCGEPLLALGEAIAVGGSLTLALLPPELRPVADWLEADDAAPLLADLAKEVLDRKEPWASRRVRLQQTALSSRANAQLLNAAALVVEAYGDVRRARREPFDLLLAWRDDRAKRFPAMPAVLRRALGEPHEAGMPADDKHQSDATLIAQQALQRAVESGSLPAGARLDGASLALRATAAAHARAQGNQAACSLLLAGPVPAALRTGCRSDEPAASFVVSRPRAQGGFEIVAVSGSDELVLLRWPRWVLFPLVVPAGGRLVFADNQGIWAAELDGSEAPRLLAAGEFRHLSLSPNGTTIAAASWPSGRLIVLPAAGGVRELEADASGGAAWLSDELLVAAGKQTRTVVSLGGGSRPFPAELPCSRSLARSGGSLWVGSAAPCEPGIVRVPLGEGEPHLELKRGDAPFGIVAAPNEALLLAEPEGVFRWRPGESPVRVSGGLTPGPG